VTNTGSVIDNTGQPSVTGTLKVGKKPEGVAVTDDGSLAYVTNARSGTVSVIDTATRKTTTIKVGKKPTGVALTVDGSRALVTNAGANTVSVIDVATGGVTATVDDAGHHPVGMATGAFRHSMVVSLGDSFISGVAGRWRGNGASGNEKGDSWGTDRAAYICKNHREVCEHDPARVYGTTNGGCLRAGSAEILNAGIGVERRLNLACSGAETRNVNPGGEWWKGEAPQADQLRWAARHERIKLVVMNIGGNDMGFRGIITTCIKAFLYPRGTHCNKTQREPLAGNLKKTQPKVEGTIEKVQKIMSDAGYDANDYRFVVQSYPNPVAPGGRNRYPVERYVRQYLGGCPVFNDDSDWVAESVVPDISEMLGKAARERKVEFLDVRDLFKYHEVCAKAADQANSKHTALDPDFGHVSEWARFLDLLGSQGGVRDETVHPNYYGQQALGSCLAAVYRGTTSRPDHTCVHGPGYAPTNVTLYNLDWH
jgi:YVTN family beta-propeller protein